MTTLRVAALALAFGLTCPAGGLAQTLQSDPSERAHEDGGADAMLPLLVPPPAHTTGVAQLAQSSPPPGSYAYPPAYPPAPYPGSDPRAARTWYGWQSIIAYLAADAALLMTSALVAETGSGAEIIPVAAGVRAHAGMIVHFAHGNWGRGFASLGLVAGGAATGTLMGGTTGLVASDACTGEMAALACVAYGGLIGLVVGTITGTVIDVAVLAYDEPTEEYLPAEATVHLGAVPTPDGLAFGAVGTF